MARSGSIDPLQAVLYLGIGYLAVRAFSSLDVAALLTPNPSQPHPNPNTANTGGQRGPTTPGGAPIGPVAPAAVDLLAYGAAGFAWEPSTGQVVRITPYQVIGQGMGSPEQAAAAVQRWLVQQAGTPAGPPTPQAVDLAGYGAPGFAWEPNTGNLVTITPYTVIGHDFTTASDAAAGAAQWWAQQQGATVGPTGPGGV